MPSINLVKIGLIVKKESLFLFIYLNLRTVSDIYIQCLSFDCISTLTSTITLSRWFAIYLLIWTPVWKCEYSQSIFNYLSIKISLLLSEILSNSIGGIWEGRTYNTKANFFTSPTSLYCLIAGWFLDCMITAFL
jgi:hypothetical protein